MQEISTIVRNAFRALNGAKEAPTFEVTTTPNFKQLRGKTRSFVAGTSD